MTAKTTRKWRTWRCWKRHIVCYLKQLLYSEPVKIKFEK